MQRAITSIVRRPGKTAILLIVVFILANLIAGAISVKESIRNTNAVILDKVGALLSIEVDYDQLMNNGGKMQLRSIPIETIETIGKSEYVKYYDYITKIWLQSVSLKSYINNGNSTDVEILPFSAKLAIDRPAIETSTFQLTGGQNSKIADFEQGKVTLVDGRTFTEDEFQNGNGAVLISKNVATLNNLSIGQKFKLHRDFYDYGDDFHIMASTPNITTKEFEFTIVGIFEPNKSASVDEKGQVSIIVNDYENVIYTTNAEINKIWKYTIMT
jgi:putative ABC transport system permease protein